jgi:hypothetical protein
VVLVDIWTYSCINCMRTLPYVRAWASKYKDHGLVVIDNDCAIWKSFNNSYWPAFYFIDSQGPIRHSHFGEGDYASSERTIQDLLREAGRKDVPTGLVRP